MISFCGQSAAMQAPKGVRMKIQYKFATETVTIEVDDR